jgi:hypothetical protein
MGDLLTILHQQADGRKVGLEHSGVHGEAQLLISTREPGLQSVEALEWVSRSVPQEKFNALCSNIDSDCREARRCDAPGFGILLH